jgi:bifunctional non-homologous end joining protein LigD
MCAHCLPGPEPVCPDCRCDLPRHVEPMLAAGFGMPGDPHRWGFEFKWDGVRALCYWDGAQLRLESRNLVNVTHRYPEYHDLGSALGKRPCLLDGEIVAINAAGRPDFALLQRRMHLTAASEIAAARRKVRTRYMLFDVLYHNGASTMELPYRERRKILQEMKIAHPHCRSSPSYAGEGRAVLDTARAWGLEGAMAKRLDSPYRPWQRSPDWRKVKIVQRQDLVIGGWTAGKRAPWRVGALLLGYYDDGPALRYAGRVGTGFDAHDQAILVEKLRRLSRTMNPFGEQVTRRGVHFVAPQLVVEVEFRRWPEGALIQQAAYKGLRMDTSPSDVTREIKGSQVRESRPRKKRRRRAVERKRAFDA